MKPNFERYRNYIQNTPVNEVKQDKDIKDKEGTQPAKYYTGLSKGQKDKRDAQFKRQAKMDDDNPAAYKPAPGDADAKTKPSVHTRKFKKMYGEGDAMKQAKARIDSEKARDKIRFDRMRDMARTRDAQTKNRTTN